ncbi:DUF5988 family protein [Micromonospora sp. NPDC051925]|uniref:DUF5988 family protein n=1 Tax=Micromonospora sp. NPDC051925 TaxID=3364288 RepID=UPI0037C4F3A8
MLITSREGGASVVAGGDRAPRFQAESIRREWEKTMSVTQVEVVLSGGPIDLSTTQRSVPEAALGQILKIRHGAGYEHFVHDGEYRTVNGYEAAVFRWTGRTKIAE